MIKYRSYQLPLLILGFVLVLVLWNTPAVYPVKIFTVFLHELSHGLAALLTGGRIVAINLTADQGGLAATAGGWPIAIASAGYLGSMVLGGLIFLIASRTRADRLLSWLLALVMAVTAILLVRNLFGLIFCLAFAAVLAVLARWGGSEINDFVLKLLGLSSMLYAIIDIYSDLIVRTVPTSDAAAMSQLLFGPPVMWGILWMVIAILAAALVLKISLFFTSPKD